MQVIAADKILADLARILSLLKGEELISVTSNAVEPILYSKISVEQNIVDVNIVN